MNEEISGIGGWVCCLLYVIRAMVADMRERC